MSHPVRSTLLTLAVSTPLVFSLQAQTVIPNYTGTDRYNANTANGSWILNEGDTRSVSGSEEGIRIANSGTAGTYTLTINGSVIQSAASETRAIRTGDSGSGVNVNITIGQTGFVRGTGGDAIQGRNNGTFNLTNLGTIYGGNLLTGQPASPGENSPTALSSSKARGLNLRDVTGGGTVFNGSDEIRTALIRSDSDDAVRVGSNFTFTNYGTLLAAGIVNDAATNNTFNDVPHNSTTNTYAAGAGFSFEDDGASKPMSNSSLINYGLISGARHGVQAGEYGSNLTVTNHAGGQIIGRNGSGIGFDTTTTDPAGIVVHNHGLIRGDYAGEGNVIDRTGNPSLYHDGDGDGIDIDGAATINNYAGGQIISTGAGGYDSDGRANNSEAISIGGGVIVNDGLIRGYNRGIIVNNDSVASRSGVAATTITNNAGGAIEGQDGFAIRLENKTGTAADNDTIVNHGTIIGTGAIPDPDAVVLRQNGLPDPHSTGTLDGITYSGEGLARFIRGDGSAIQMGEGDDVLTNTGTITGTNGRAINMEGGNDTVNFDAGTITGDINGGAGTDTLNLGAGVATASAVKSFEQINVASGSATLSGVVSGTTLNKGGAGALVLAAANDYTGLTTVEEGTLVVNNVTGSATGLGGVMVNAGAFLAGGGIIAGDVVFDGILAPGNSIGTLTVGGDVTWNGDAANAWQFELGLGDVSDRLLIGGDFLKGDGADFVFDFLSGAFTGEFVLVEWEGSTDFEAADFSYINLGGGLSGAFAIDGNQLVFSAVPEPAAAGALLGLGALGFAALRRRRLR